MSRFIGKANAIVCEFECCDSGTLVNINIITFVWTYITVNYGT